MNTAFQHCRRLLAALLLLNLLGCTSVNRRLNDPSIQYEARAHNQTRAALGVNVPPAQLAGLATFNPLGPRQWRPQPFVSSRPAARDGVFIGLALSGGGSRSANFAAGCMFQLQRIGLLQHVDYISAVSGGTLAGAYYCVSGDTWNPANVQRKLTHNFAADVIWGTIVPWNFFALTFSDFDRGDLLARSFNEHLFTRAGRTLTFADLRDDRPHLLINATNLQSGKRFVFSNESFDQINADLKQYPIAYACAASSAVPVLIHHVTLRDYSTAFDQFVHLMDGGIVDNLGIRSLIETYEAHQSSASRAGLPVPYPKGAIFIIIDAETLYDAKLSDKGDLGLLDTIAMGAGLASTALLDRASTATMSDLILRNAADDATAGQLRRQIQTLEKTGYLSATDHNGRPVRVLHLALPRIKELTDQPFASFGSSVNSIQTYYNIAPTEAHHLYLAAELLCTQLFKSPLDSMLNFINAPSD